MAKDKNKTGLTEKIGLFIDKTLTFGGGLSYSQKDINNAINAIDAQTDYSIDSWKDIKTQSDFDNFKSILKSAPVILPSLFLSSFFCPPTSPPDLNCFAQSVKYLLMAY